MGGVIGDLLPLAVGVAVSPLPVIAAILMLMSARAAAVSTGFAAGWLLGIVAVTVVFTLVGGGVQSGDGPSTTVSVVKLVLGAALLVLGGRRWHDRDAAAEAPRWMQAIDEFTLPKGLALGFALAAANPKNLLLGVAAGVTIGSAGLPVGQATGAVAVFAVIAASTVVVPVAGCMVAADALRGPLDTLKTWLQEHNDAMMGALLLVLGAVLLGKGIGGLS